MKLYHNKTIEPNFLNQFLFCGGQSLSSSSGLLGKKEIRSSLKMPTYSTNRVKLALIHSLFSWAGNLNKVERYSVKDING